MKSILQVCAFGAPNPGNFINNLLKLQEKMLEKQYETIYAFADTAKDREWCKELEKTNKVYYLPVAKARILPETYLKIKKIYQENDIDIVHSHFELYDIPVTIMAPRNVKIFWHLHDAIKESYLYGPLSRRILTDFQYRICGKRAVLLTVSQLHGEFVKQIGFNAEKVLYVPNGISFERLEHEYSSVTDNNFLMFGWQVRRKGVDLAVAAETFIKKEDYEIVIVGQEECKQFIEENCISNKVCFKKPVSDIKELYSKTKVFLHLSRAEGLSYALLEAIYFGMYVICSDIPENEFAKEFKGVEFFENENVKEIAMLMNKYINMLQISFEEVEYNRKLIEEKYSLDSWCQRIMNIYGVD